MSIQQNTSYQIFTGLGQGQNRKKIENQRSKNPIRIVGATLILVKNRCIKQTWLFVIGRESYNSYCIEHRRFVSTAIKIQARRLWHALSDKLHAKKSIHSYRVARCR